ncbi:MAG: hypothetical protein AABW56_05375 [Nanoarchaeota archaeon]
MDLKQKLLALAIAIVLVLFIAVGIDTFYKAPENPCNSIYETQPKTFPSNCDFVQDTNRTNCIINQQLFYENQSIESQKCYDEFQPRDNLYKRNVFIILTIIGGLTIIIGLLVKNLHALSFGLMLGGLVNIVYGVIRYWSQMNEYLRFIILGILLFMLIWVSYKKLK